MFHNYILTHYFNIVNIYIFFHIALNVLVVYDGLATRISETVGFARLPNCGGEKCRRGQSPNRYFSANRVLGASFAGI